MEFVLVSVINIAVEFRGWWNGNKGVIQPQSYGLGEQNGIVTLVECAQISVGVLNGGL